MDFEECIRFANENPVAWVATTSGDEPKRQNRRCGLVTKKYVIFL